MKKLIVSLTLLVTGLATAESYKLDNAHTEVGFSVKHLLISNVKGRFQKYTGTFDYDKTAKTLKNLNIEIDPASISTQQKDRDDHLKSDDFFDVKKYKKVTYKEEKAEFSADGKTIKVFGKLKIKDIEQPVVLDVTINGEVEVEGTQKIAFTASTEIDRKKWGINWNKNLDKGGLAVSEDVKILIEGEANLIKDKIIEKKSK